MTAGEVQSLISSLRPAGFVAGRAPILKIGSGNRHMSTVFRHMELYAHCFHIFV